MIGEKLNGKIVFYNPTAKDIKSSQETTYKLIKAKNKNRNGIKTNYYDITNKLIF